MCLESPALARRFFVTSATWEAACLTPKLFPKEDENPVFILKDNLVGELIHKTLKNALLYFIDFKKYIFNVLKLLGCVFQWIAMLSYI